MKFSIDWLKDYIDLPMESAEIADLLTHAGLEVEGIDFRQIALNGVISVCVDDVRPHPDAESLSVCTVTGGDRQYTIVCGDRNVKKGDMVPLATENTELPDGRKIAKSSVRGVASEGMLCSEKELGLSEDASGVMTLPEGTPHGRPLSEVLPSLSPRLRIESDGSGKRKGLVHEYSDSVFEVGLTPNRPDCLSVFGFARELSALTGREAHMPLPELAESAEAASAEIAVENRETTLCTRYTARVVRGVKVGPSPLWLRRRLESSGVRPINNVVDVTNYVMMELGQPLHAFDLEKIEERKIIVRLAKKGERIVTLDEAERSLEGDELVICDGKRPVALAGIMGGAETAVEDGTAHILLESAHFLPGQVRKIARRIGLHSESSHRFERGTDPGGVAAALDRAAGLIAELSGGVVLAGRIDTRPDTQPGRPIPFRPERCRRVLGLDLGDAECTGFLKALGIAVEGSKGEYVATPPSYRVDLEREIDLIEEVARLKGYAAIPVDYSLGGTSLGGAAEKGVDLFLLKRFMAASGFSEAVNYSFHSHIDVEKLGLPPGSPLLDGARLLNPISEELSTLRTTLLPGLLNTVSLNMNRQNRQLKLFETGKVFSRKGKGFDEENLLAAVMTGDSGPLLWQGERDIYDLKGVLENLLDLIGVRDYTFSTSADAPYGHPGRSARAELGGKEIAFLCEVHPAVARRFSINQRVCYFELRLDPLEGFAGKISPFRDIPQFPSVERDVALLVDSTVALKDILAAVNREAHPLLEETAVFDQFSGGSLPAGKKSIAVRMRYRARERTLTDAEVNEAHAAVVGSITGKIKADIR